MSISRSPRLPRHSLAQRLGWRTCLVGSGIAMILGGPLHPESEASDSMRIELATMTADGTWVPAHVLTFVSTVLLTAGLWLARRRGAWPASTDRVLTWACVAFSLYVVESAFHLAAVVDSDALRQGEAAPIAFTHLALAAVLYPVSGAAMVLLALSLGRAWGGWRRLVVLPGIVGGTVHALSVPLTLLLPDTELSAAFASAALSTAVFAVGLGLTRGSAGRVDRAPHAELAAA